MLLVQPLVCTMKLAAPVAPCLILLEHTNPLQYTNVSMFISLACALIRSWEQDKSISAKLGPGIHWMQLGLG